MNYPTQETTQMTAEQREQRISEVRDLMEAGEATHDDLWDATFPNREWCELTLRGLGFHFDYDRLLEIIEDTSNGGSTTIFDAVSAYRTIPYETEGLEYDKRGRQISTLTLIKALRYRQHYLALERTLN